MFTLGCACEAMQLVVARTNRPRCRADMKVSLAPGTSGKCQVASKASEVLHRGGKDTVMVRVNTECSSCGGGEVRPTATTIGDLDSPPGAGSGYQLDIVSANTIASMSLQSASALGRRAMVVARGSACKQRAHSPGTANSASATSDPGAVSYHRHVTHLAIVGHGSSPSAPKAEILAHVPQAHGGTQKVVETMLYMYIADYG